MERATATTTTRPTPSRARTTSRMRSAARPSTTRPSAASSARSGSGWIIGRSCERSGVEADGRAPLWAASFDQDQSVIPASLQTPPEVYSVGKTDDQDDSGADQRQQH